MFKGFTGRPRGCERHGRECPLRSCPLWRLYAKAARERDELQREIEELRKENEELRKENEELRWMTGRAPEKTEPRNTYEELERSWDEV